MLNLTILEAQIICRRQNDILKSEVNWMSFEIVMYSV